MILYLIDIKTIGEDIKSTKIIFVCFLLIFISNRKNKNNTHHINKQILTRDCLKLTHQY